MTPYDSSVSSSFDSEETLFERSGSEETVFEKTVDESRV